jgi:hypothetical protein
MVAYRATERILHVFYTSASDGGKWLSSNSRHFEDGKALLSVYWIVGWADCSAGVETMVQMNKTTSVFQLPQ